MTWEAVGVIVAAVATVGGLCSYIMGKVFRLGECITRLGQVEGRIEGMQNTLDHHAEMLTAIRSVLLLKHKGLEEVFTLRHSPRSLNEIGNKVLSDMNGMEFLKTNKSALFARIDALNPKSKLDIEQAAQSACMLMSADDIFIPVRDFVYSYPVQEDKDGRKIDIDLAAACYILSFPLRDMYIEEKGVI